MKLIRTALAVAALGLMLSACSGETASTPSSPESSTAVERNAAKSAPAPVAVENQLKAWWSGDGIPITWKVSETDNFDWDGVSRPDHAPPNGLQGLEQAAFSGFYRTRPELNMNASQVTFVLTPTITIDGQIIDLQPIRFITGEGRATWFMSGAEIGRQCWNGMKPKITEYLMQKTPRGSLGYYLELACNENQSGAEVTIKN